MPRNAFQTTGLIVVLAMGATAMPGCGAEPIPEAKGESRSAQKNNDEGETEVLELTTTPDDRNGTNLFGNYILVCDTAAKTMRQFGAFTQRKPVKAAVG